MIDILKNLEIFSGYDKSELEVLKKFIKLKTFNDGESVISRDELKKELYIVKSGKILSALKMPGSAERRQAEYNEGDVFGELSVFGNRPSFDSYTSSGVSELLVIGEDGFRELVEAMPGYSIKLISKLLSHTIMQLRRSSRFLADVVEWGEKASRRVITDDLTGLYNRAFLDDAIENFFYISQSNNKPLSFLMLDIDNFRKVNEVLGPEAGNGVIVEFAGIIKRIISKHGILARYGGDEFSILLPETDLNTAVEYAEEIRSSVESFSFSKHLKGHDITISTSIGVSSFPETASDLAVFRQKADDSLYMAKESGRNRIKCME